MPVRAPHYWLAYVEKFARDLLSVSDNFDRALQNVSEDALAEMSEKGIDGQALIDEARGLIADYTE